MKNCIFALAAAVALSFTAHNAQAQCPANSLTALSGNYVFSAEGIAPLVYGITGVFKATTGVDRAGNPIGILTITATSFYEPQVARFMGPSNGNQPTTKSSTGSRSATRLETDTGNYQINADCTGGTLSMKLSSRPMQYDFWFFDGGRQIYFVSTINGLQANGRAAIAPAGCPAGVTNPIQLLVGNSSFVARGFGPQAVLRRIVTFSTDRRDGGGWGQEDSSYAIAGTWNASLGADPRIGRLLINATSDLSGSITRQEFDAGSFQANADCSGGQLIFNLSSHPVQFDFWWAEGFQRLAFISTSAGVPVIGSASR